MRSKVLKEKNYRLAFDRGSILLHQAIPEDHELLPSVLKWDSRVEAFRAMAVHYRHVVRHLLNAGASLEDKARVYPEISLTQSAPPTPYPHQMQALEAWAQGKRGVVELPTGSGKTQLALNAMEMVGRGTLIVVPTLDLVLQWSESLKKTFGLEPGVVGGGQYEVAAVTVTTYASAYRHGAHFGDRFGLVVFDECHHLAGEGFSHIGEVLIAPYRLGLSATVERPDMRHKVLNSLIGPMVFRQSIRALSGRYLAEYQTKVVEAELSQTEKEAYQTARETYLGFVRDSGLSLSTSQGFQRFMYTAVRTPEGQMALKGYFRQKQLAFAPEAKFQICENLLEKHRGEKILIFTNDNHTAYRISTRFLLPLITHQTGISERKAILTAFRGGKWPILVTSKVLNEGVDVPEASVAIILSGNASVREHVQRLGRILRRNGDKQAVLYEVLTRATAEENTSKRRRMHDAYR